VAVGYTATFQRQLKRLARKYRRIRQDLDALTSQLRAGETPGDRLQGTGYTAYKARVRNTDAQRGTSGGYRVIYYIVDADDILMLTVYSKTEQEDIDTEIVIRMIEDALAR
jgi:mRNA-degrading endonuclease RelE of RelBE toxin-antitoxin system